MHHRDERWCDRCHQHGNHDTSKHEEYMAGLRAVQARRKARYLELRSAEKKTK